MALGEQGRDPWRWPGGTGLMTPEWPDLPPARRQELESLAQRLDQRFRNLGLLDQALRHSSYAHDNPESGPSNERLEFLGDAVLALTVSALLLSRFPESSEGEMSRGRAALVNARQLAALARQLRSGGPPLAGAGGRTAGGPGESPPSWLMPWKRCWGRSIWTAAWRRRRA